MWLCRIVGIHAVLVGIFGLLDLSKFDIERCQLTLASMTLLHNLMPHLATTHLLLIQIMDYNKLNCEWHRIIN